MWEQYYDQAYAAVYNYLPTLLTVSPVTMAGLGIVAVSIVLYLLTRAPEFLLVIFTALAYSAVPLVHLFLS